MLVENIVAVVEQCDLVKVPKCDGTDDGSQVDVEQAVPEYKCVPPHDRMTMQICLLAYQEHTGCCHLPDWFGYRTADFGACLGSHVFFKYVVDAVESLLEKNFVYHQLDLNWQEEEREWS